MLLHDSGVPCKRLTPMMPKTSIRNSVTLNTSANSGIAANSESRTAEQYDSTRIFATMQISLKRADEEAD